MAIFQIIYKVLLPANKDNLTTYILYGNIINYQREFDFETLKQGLRNETIDIERNSYGKVIFLTIIEIHQAITLLPVIYLSIFITFLINKT